MFSTAVTNPPQAKNTEVLQPFFVAAGCLEVTVGITAIAADYYTVFNTASVILGVLGVLVLVYCVANPASVKVYDICAAALLFGYGTGTLNSLTRFAIDNQALLPDSAVAQYWCARSLGFIGAACGVLHLVGRIDSDGYLFRSDWPFSLHRRRVLYASATVLLIFCGLLATGRIGYMANVLLQPGSPAVSPVSVLVLLLATPVGALAFATALKVPKQERRILLVISIALLILQFGLGRRIMLFSMIAYAMSALFVMRPYRVLTARNLLILLISFGVLHVASTSFYALRMASWRLGAGTHSSRFDILKLIPEAARIYSDDSRGNLDANIQKNLKSRSFVLEYLAEIAEAEAVRPPLYGEDALRALVVATPSVIYRGKYRNPLFETEEELVNPHFGFPVKDMPNSLFTAGMADFGTLGLFFYPTIICVALSLLMRLVRRVAPEIVAFIFGIAICQSLLTVEADLSSYFVTSRTLILAIGLLWALFLRVRVAEADHKLSHG